MSYGKINTPINRAIREVAGYQGLIRRFERSISILGRSPSTFKNYSIHIAVLTLHYGKILTEFVKAGTSQ